MLGSAMRWLGLERATICQQKTVLHGVFVPVSWCENVRLNKENDRRGSRVRSGPAGAEVEAA